MNCHYYRSFISRASLRLIQQARKIIMLFDDRYLKTALGNWNFHMESASNMIKQKFRKSLFSELPVFFLRYLVITEGKNKEVSNKNYIPYETTLALVSRLYVIIS